MGQRGTRKEPLKKPAHSEAEAEAQFIGSLPADWRKAVEAMPRPGGPGFLGCQIQLLLAFQEKLIAQVPKRPRAMDLVHAARVLDVLVQEVRKTLVAMQQARSDHAPSKQHLIWGQPMEIERDADGAMVTRCPQEH